MAFLGQIKFVIGASADPPARRREADFAADFIFNIFDGFYFGGTQIQAEKPVSQRKNMAMGIVESGHQGFTFAINYPGII